MRRPFQRIGAGRTPFASLKLPSQEELMPDKKPTYEQGQLQLQLYDLRRAAKLRQARDWFTQNFFADRFEESQRMAPFGSHEGTDWMSVVGYWEQPWAFGTQSMVPDRLVYERPGQLIGSGARVGPI